MKKLTVVALIFLVLPVVIAETNLTVSRTFSNTTVEPGHRLNMTVVADEGFTYWSFEVSLPNLWRADGYPGRALFYNSSENSSKTIELITPGEVGEYNIAGQWEIVEINETNGGSFDTERITVVSQSSVEACEPIECHDIRKYCGQYEDGCGGILDCGDCSDGKECSRGRCVYPKPRPFKWRYENATFTIFGILLGKVDMAIRQSFTLVRNKLRGSFSLLTKGEMRCRLSRFRVESWEVVDDSVDVTGTGMLYCNFPVDVEIKDGLITGTYDGTEVFRAEDLE